jgi:hypothetical protein
MSYYISRKGAKTQRKTKSGFRLLTLRLCALREKNSSGTQTLSTFAMFLARCVFDATVQRGKRSQHQKQ